MNATGTPDKAPTPPDWGRPLALGEAIAYPTLGTLIRRAVAELGNASISVDIERMADARRTLHEAGRILAAIAEGDQQAAEQVNDEAIARLEQCKAAGA